MKITKILNRDLTSNVQAQSDCGSDCKVKVWAGKKEADGSSAGCWYTYQYTGRWNPLT